VEWLAEFNTKLSAELVSINQMKGIRAATKNKTPEALESIKHFSFSIVFTNEKTFI
jgi:uncharacterized protein YdhG (YjbR/CyaY superfamily)